MNSVTLHSGARYCIRDENSEYNGEVVIPSQPAELLNIENADFSINF